MAWESKQDVERDALRIELHAAHAAVAREAFKRQRWRSEATRLQAEVDKLKIEPWRAIFPVPRSDPMNRDF